MNPSGPYSNYLGRQIEVCAGIVIIKPFMFNSVVVEHITRDRTESDGMPVESAQPLPK